MHASPSTARVSVRPATMQDAAQLAELCGQLGYPSTTEEVERRLRLILPDQESAVFIAESGGNVVGWIDVFISRLVETDQHAEIGGFVVDESCRSQGVGRLLLERAEEWARAEGCLVMTLRSNVIRERAHAFYENLGYSVVKTQKAFRKTL
jgi:GNAT superfamily N-acetyltransferase